ncbi:MAG: hypothetical protein L0H96_20280 [Humibacillus sp.]|nr:hypothetical protein [Humibacillus sp.]MDN5779234.1 hypothetical protein [Humibacillus sp.]
MASIAPGGGVDLDTVIRQVKEALLLVQLEQAERAARTGVAVDVVRIELTLRTMVERTAGGEVRLTVPIVGQELGGGVDTSWQQVQTVELTLVPPDGLPKRVPGWGLSEELARAVLGVEDAVRTAAETEPRFEMERASVELNVVVGRGGSISLVAKGSSGREVAHTVKVHLEPRLIIGP